MYKKLVMIQIQKLIKKLIFSLQKNSLRSQYSFVVYVISSHDSQNCMHHTKDSSLFESDCQKKIH